MEALRRAEAGPRDSLQVCHIRELSEVNRDELRSSDIHARHRERPARPTGRVDEPEELRPSDPTGGPHRLRLESP